MAAGGTSQAGGPDKRGPHHNFILPLEKKVQRMRNEACYQTEQTGNTNNTHRGTTNKAKVRKYMNGTITGLTRDTCDPEQKGHDPILIPPTQGHTTHTSLNIFLSSTHIDIYRILRPISRGFKIIFYGQN